MVCMYSVEYSVEYSVLPKGCFSVYSVIHTFVPNHNGEVKSLYYSVMTHFVISYYSFKD